MFLLRRRVKFKLIIFLNHVIKLFACINTLVFVHLFFDWSNKRVWVFELTPIHRFEWLDNWKNYVESGVRWELWERVCSISNPTNFNCGAIAIRQKNRKYVVDKKTNQLTENIRTDGYYEARKLLITNWMLTKNGFLCQYADEHIQRLPCHTKVRPVSISLLKERCDWDTAEVKLEKSNASGKNRSPATENGNGSYTPPQAPTDTHTFRKSWNTL